MAGGECVKGHVRTAAAKASTDLITAFARVEKILRSWGIARSERYVIVLQLLVLRLATEEELDGAVADVLLRSVSLNEQARVLDRMLSQVMAHYGAFLPSTVSATCGCTGQNFVRLWQEMSGVSVLKSSAETLQELFMTFRGVLPLTEPGAASELGGFIAMLINPQPSDSVLKTAHGLDTAAESVRNDVAAAAADLVRFNLLLYGIRHAQTVKSHVLTLLPLSTVGVGS